MAPRQSARTSPGVVLGQARGGSGVQSVGRGPERSSLSSAAPTKAASQPAK
jgi:hypothetical protein